MAGEGWRKLTVTVVVFIVLALASGWMVMETEGKTCYKRSSSFRGLCTSDDECLRVCDGFCSHGSCICPVPC